MRRLHRSLARSRASFIPSSRHCSKVVVVGDRAFPERGFVVAERMRRAEEVLARPDLPERVERQRIVVDRKTPHPDMERRAEICVHHQLLVAHCETALEPAGRMQDEIGAALHGGEHRHRALGHRLPVRNLRRGERPRTAQRKPEPPRELSDAPAAQRRLRVPNVGEPDRNAVEERKSPKITGAPGRSSWVRAQPAMVSASACAIAPALITGPIAPPRMNGTTTAHYWRGRRRGAPSSSCRRTPAANWR